MSITRFNKGKKFDVELKEALTVKLAALTVGEVYPVNAIMFTEKGRYGKSAFVVTKVGDDVTIVYLPKHKVKECEEIVAEDAIVEDIKSGRVGFEPETYEDEEGATRYSIKWVDC